MYAGRANRHTTPVVQMRPAVEPHHPRSLGVGLGVRNYTDALETSSAKLPDNNQAQRELVIQTGGMMGIRKTPAQRQGKLGIHSTNVHEKNMIETTEQSSKTSKRLFRIEAFKSA